jgi:hypothetical protein
MPAWLIAFAICSVLGVGAGVVALTSGGDDLEAVSRKGAIVWAVGDGADGSAAAKTVAALIAKDKPQRVLYLGDVYETGTAAEFRDHFATVYAGVASKMEPTPGNHDWPNHTTGYDPYWRSVLKKRVPHHYAFSLAGWRFISLNSETPTDERQLAFLRRELFRAPGTCILPFWHRPRLNAGEHEEEQLDVDPLWREVKGKVPLVLSGHDHNLQRFRGVGGTVQYVIGAGGRQRYDVDERDPRLAFSRDDVFGALRMSLAPGIARMTMVSADGEVLDRSTLRCREGSS